VVEIGQQLLGGGVELQQVVLAVGVAIDRVARALRLRGIYA